QNLKEVIINTEWGAFGASGSLDFIRTEIDRELDDSSLNPAQQKFEKMISALYLGEIVRLIIVDLVQRGLLFPGRMQKSPRIRPDYNIFLILRGSFYAKHVSDIESDKSEGLSLTSSILTGIGIHEPSFDDCKIIQEVCKTVSQRASSLAAAAIAVLINRLNVSSVTIAVDGTLFRHHDKFKKNLIRTIDRLVQRTFKFVIMDGLYIPDGRKLALIDRDWILDDLPHLGNPDDNQDSHHLLATAAAANSGSGIGASSSATSGTSGAGTTSGTTGHTGINQATGGGAHTSGGHAQNSNNHSLLNSQDDFEGDLTLLSEIVDETQNKWSDFGLNQLLTPYAKSLTAKPK
ncbi:unnamed protein product, partial [Didymodactylos carnosus]